MPLSVTQPSNGPSREPRPVRWQEQSLPSGKTHWVGRCPACRKPLVFAQYHTEADYSEDEVADMHYNRVSLPAWSMSLADGFREKSPGHYERRGSPYTNFGTRGRDVLGPNTITIRDWEGDLPRVQAPRAVREQAGAAPTLTALSLDPDRENVVSCPGDHRAGRRPTACNTPVVIRPPMRTGYPR